MAVKEIAKHFILTCDGCGLELQSASQSRPKGWAILTFEQAAQDWSGNECADASVRSMYCSICRAKMASAINNVHAALRDAARDWQGEAKTAGVGE